MAKNSDKETIEEESTVSLVNIDFTNTEEFDYDDWLEFFRKIKGGAGAIIAGIEYIRDNAPPDGYAAARRWLEIFDEPSKMDKLYKGRLSKSKTEEVDIMAIAVGDDDEEFYKTLIQQNTAQLNSSNVSQQEVARLTQNINIFRKELREIRARKPKEGTVLARVLDEASKPRKKPTVKRTPKKPAVKITKKAVATKKTTVKAAKKVGAKNGK